MLTMGSPISTTLPERRQGMAWLNFAKEVNKYHQSPSPATNMNSPSRTAQLPKSRLVTKDLLRSMLSPDRENSKTRQALWIIIVSVSMTAFSTQSYLLISDYFKYGTTVYMDISLGREIPFPAVTICNKNMIKHSLISNNSEWMGYAGDKAPHDPRKKRQAPPGSPSLANEIVCVNSSGDDIDCAVTALGKNEAFSRRFLLAAGVERLAYEEKIQLGYDISDMLVLCSWFGQECNSSAFRHIWVPGAGNCYTFNHDPRSALIVRAAGPQYGLTLILFAQTKTYLPLISESFGFRVAIHSPSEAALPNENGFDIPTTQETSSSLRVTDIERLEPPYATKCYEETKPPDPFTNAYTEWFPETEYTSRVCMLTCLQRSFMERCGCADPFLPSTGQAFTNINKIQDGEMAFCEYLNETDRNCINLVQSEMSETGLDCWCPPKCMQKMYTITSSSSIWPTRDYRDHLISKLKNSLIKNERTIFYDPDLAKVNIYFDDLNVQKIHHRPAYEWPMLVSDIGGLLGLWLGLSILAFYEFLEGQAIKLKAILRGCKK